MTTTVPQRIIALGSPKSILATTTMLSSSTSSSSLALSRTISTLGGGSRLPTQLRCGRMPRAAASHSTIASISTFPVLHQPLSAFSSKNNTTTESLAFRSFQRQNMSVMVTKTKVSDLPSFDTQEEMEQPDLVTHKTEKFQVLSKVLTVTPSCLNRVERLIQMRLKKEMESGSEEANKYFLRVFVDAGGCSGFQYQFELDHEFDAEEDIVVVASAENSDPRIVVDSTSLGFLEGSTLDYVQEMIKSAFVISDNPQSESACGCGSSFAVKNFAANPALD